MAMRQSSPNGPMSGDNQDHYYEERPPYNNYGPNRPAGDYNAGLGLGLGVSYGNVGTTLTDSQNGQRVGHQAHNHAASVGYMGGYRGKAHSGKHSADDSRSSDSSSGSDSDNEHHGRRKSYN